jgi:cell division transport system permease protein
MVARVIGQRTGALPLGEVPAGGALAVLTGSLVCLAVLVLAASGGAGRTLQRLEAEPRRLTIALPMAEAGQVGSTLSRIVGELRAMPGMLALRDVPAAELHALLPPGVLAPSKARNISLPRLIEADFAAQATPDPDELATRLGSMAPGVTVASSSGDLAARSASLRRAQRLGWLGGGLLLTGLVVGVGLVVRWALAAQADGVRLLRSLGASDTDVSRQFEEHAARAALGGAGVGFLVALALLALLGLAARFWSEPGLLEFRLTPADWLSLAAVPVGGGLLAGWVAKLTVRVGLLRLR